jgi:hypothetical protein
MAALGGRINAANTSKRGRFPFHNGDFGASAPVILQNRAFPV